MSLDPATVRHIAHLARIRIEPDEVPRLQEELNSILGWVEQLAEVNVDDVAPLNGATELVQRLRADIVNDGADAPKILANAPERQGDFFTVPKVVE